ncbi:ribonucleotide reductase stimulatory protein [Ignavigranum ruoffiae]
MAQIVYFSLTGQTRRFVEKLPQYTALEIDPVNPFIENSEDFILVVPTYERPVVEVVDDFLQTADNRSYCQGIFGGGNRNFAQLFCFTAKDMARDYQLPLLHLFEFQGSDYDVDQLKNALEAFRETTNH